MSSTFASMRVMGALLPNDVLLAVVDGTAAGLSSSDFHLGGERPREAAARTWTYLTGVYRRFRNDLARLPEGDPAVGVTRERWLTLLLSALDYGRVPATGPGGITVGDRQFPVSHTWGATPIHLLGWGVPLDRRSPGVPGAARHAPHALVQELLNRSEAYTWALLSNGRVLRLLRDSTSLTGQAFVEFDLEAMFEGDLYADYALLYLLLHESRVEVPDGQASNCWLERWRTTAVSQGVRALNLLRDGVEQALEILGTGFLQHPENTGLRQRLHDGTARLDDLHQSLLRTVYRLLFWSVAEDRQVLLDPDSDPSAAERYHRYFSSARLRDLARRRYGSPHHDLWDAVALVMSALSRPGGEPRLGLPGLGGLFASLASDILNGAKLGNRELLAAVRSLSIVQPKGQPQRTVDFRHLGADELGSIYESLLELIPRRDPVAQTFSLEAAAGNDRKTSGSYYTPSELVELVLDTALDPVLDDAEKQRDPEAALLAVTACDPAIGSGHFMVATARRIASRLAMARTGEIDPTPTTVQDAMHDVVARCIYGVDVNPMAADLAKVSLWMEAMSPGRPLSFLDHHIKVGNSLLGTTPALLHAGIPDVAYAALTGDDKAVVKAWKKLNEQQGSGQMSLLDEGGIEVGNELQRKGTAEVADRSAGARSLADIAWAAQRYATLQASDEVCRARLVADAWCAAFLAPKTKDAEPITHDTLVGLAAGTASESVVALVSEMASRHRLFHWHLEFPEVFRVPDGGVANTAVGWTGGFSAMLGNPPWETLQMSEKEFFATRDPDIAAAKTAAARKAKIAALETENPILFDEFAFESHRASAETHLIRMSGRYPLTATGKINTYSIFAEQFRSSLAEYGRSGIVTPTGLATDATTAAFLADCVKHECLAAFYDFENEARVFPGVTNRVRFAVSSMTGGEPAKEVRLSFLNRHVSEVIQRRFELENAEIVLLNPNTGTLPIFRTRRDADITLACYRRHPVLIRDGDPRGNVWELRFSQGLFNMASDSALFRTESDLEAEAAEFDGWAWSQGGQRWLPLYEAKMLSHWNHRRATYRDATEAQINKGTLPKLTPHQLDNPQVEPLARYWVSDRDIAKAIVSGWGRDWFLGWRDIARATDMRSFVPSVMPASAVGNKFPLAFSARPVALPILHSVWSSLIFDYIARQKQAGSGMTYFIVRQLACPKPSTFEATPLWSDEKLSIFVRRHVLELTYTSHRIKPYAVDVMGGEPGAPFRWIPDRRAQLMAELDAAMLHLYELDRDDAEHVLDSFFVLRKYEDRDFGEFRTKRLVLTEYDAMSRAAESGIPYRSPLSPPPGEGPRHEKASE
jgi:hypothetical protein